MQKALTSQILRWLVDTPKATGISDSNTMNFACWKMQFVMSNIWQSIWQFPSCTNNRRPCPSRVSLAWVRVNFLALYCTLDDHTYPVSNSSPKTHVHSHIILKEGKNLFHLSISTKEKSRSIILPSKCYLMLCYIMYL